MEPNVLVIMVILVVVAIGILVVFEIARQHKKATIKKAAQEASEASEFEVESDSFYEAPKQSFYYRRSPKDAWFPCHGLGRIYKNGSRDIILGSSAPVRKNRRNIMIVA